MAAAAKKEWQCRSCTCLNPMTATHCEACARPTHLASAFAELSVSGCAGGRGGGGGAGGKTNYNAGAAGAGAAGAAAAGAAAAGAAAAGAAAAAAARKKFNDMDHKYRTTGASPKPTPKPMFGGAAAAGAAAGVAVGGGAAKAGAGAAGRGAGAAAAGAGAGAKKAGSHTQVPPSPPPPPAETKFRVLNNESEEWDTIETQWASCAQGANEDYVAARLRDGKRPIVFKLCGIERVENAALAHAFDAKLAALLAAGRSGDEVKPKWGFHGTKPVNLRRIGQRGLLRIGHPDNPSQSTDEGYFGTPKKGVYLSRYYEYVLKYSNGQQPLEPGDEVKFMMFRVVPGKCFHVKQKQAGMDPTPGYDAHHSANFLEWYLFDEAAAVPYAILTVKAIENRRTAADDIKVDAKKPPLNQDNFSHYREPEPDYYSGSGSDDDEELCGYPRADGTPCPNKSERSKGISQSVRCGIHYNKKMPK